MSATQHRKVSMVVETKDGQRIVRVAWLDPNTSASISAWVNGKQLIKVDIPKEETK